jgi:hypothetical protein
MNYQKHLPAGLLLSYAIYSSFTSINIAHSIILFSLAGLFGFHQYLQHSEQPSLETEIAKLKTDLELQLKAQKENYELRLRKVEEENTKLALSLSRGSSSASSTGPKKVVF